MSTWNLPFFKKVDIVDSLKEENTWKEERIGNIEFPDKLTDCNAFMLANTVSEIYFPIDFIADRISKLRFYIADKAGKEIENTELNRFITSINPLFSFSDLTYQAIFSYLSDGNMIAYRTVPASYKNASLASISRVDLIQPTELTMTECTNLSKMNIKSWNELIKTARYTYNTGFGDVLNPMNLIISGIDSTRQSNSMILARSPLYKALRPINNLLAVYSARYNVYVNNGMAGIISRRVTGANGGLSEAVMPKDKKAIEADLNTYGLTGNRNRYGIKGITGVPIEFIKTIASIQELLPFEETLEDSIKISGVFQIPSGLVPRKDQPTFDNVAEQERSVWENAIMSIADSFGEYWANVCLLDKAGYQVKPDYSTVSCLEANKTQTETAIKMKLDNLKLLKEIAPDKVKEINAQIDLILNEYGQG